MGLKDFLNASRVNLVCNGPMALVVALQALDIQGLEGITSPYTFPATPRSSSLESASTGICDIDGQTYNLDPSRIESLITPKTTAIVPVHVCGRPCDIDGIPSVANPYGLPVIFDAAHSMGVRYRDHALANFGDLAIISFYATKLSTPESGALLSHSTDIEQKNNSLKNFGIAGKESVEFPGINGKMDELPATLGLYSLGIVDGEIAHRKMLTEFYRNKLHDLPGLRLQQDTSETDYNNACFSL